MGAVVLRAARTLGAALATLALLATAPAGARAQQSPDTLPTFAGPATRALMERAMIRHRAQDSAVADYRARLRYRLTAKLGRRRWGTATTLGVEEQELAVHWRRPNDLRVDVLGRRVRTQGRGNGLSSVFGRPWFVPRSVDDSVRIFSDEFPATGALHPLAASGPDWYRYAITDSITLTLPSTGALRVYSVAVRPRRTGPSLVTGRLWLDASTGDIVRWTFRYVGSGLWARPDSAGGRDSAGARLLNALANRVLTIDADLEYGLVDGRHWMPRRQVLAGVAKVPIVTDVVVSFQATTGFDDYEINTGRPIAFELPVPDSATQEAWRDSLRAERRRNRSDSLGSHDVAGEWRGGRYEIHRPSDDSLARYEGWRDSLAPIETAADARRLREASADLARLAEGLPDELTGATPRAFGYERLADALQYNRVQGLSLGLGYRVRLPVSFTNLYGTVRYGFSDERVTGRLAAVRDAPAGRLTVAGWRDLASTDPFAPGRTFGNTLNALFTGHDDADWQLTTGGGLTWETPLSATSGVDLVLGARLERQRSVAREARSALNDWLGGTGRFPANPAVADGTWGGATVRLSGVRPARWTLGAEGLTGERLTGEGATGGRAWAEVRYAVGDVRGATLRLKGGLASTDALPQLGFRAGGLNSVRGFEYGTQRGTGFWAAQLDVSVLRGGGLRPVLFIDAGRAAPAGGLFEGDVLVGGGIGVSLYSSLFRTSFLRLDVSRAITPVPTKRLRVDLTVQAPR